jgi:drug/metabolite transporter (DMT)-like permease
MDEPAPAGDLLASTDDSTTGDVRTGLAAVAVAVSAWGATGVLIKVIDMNAIAIAAWRFSIYGLLLTIALYARGNRLSKRLLVTALPGGALLAADVMLFFVAVRTTNIVNATTIGAMQPIVIAAIATRFMGEHIRRREYVAAAIAIAGVIVVITQSSGTPEWSGAGDLAAVGALCAWSGYFIVAKRTAGKLTPHEFTTGTAWWVGAFAFAVGLVSGQDMSPPPSSEIVPLAALIIVGGVIGHSLMNWGIPRLPVWLSSTMTLMIPVISSLAAWIFLGEALTVWQLLAMAVVIGALWLVVVDQTRTPLSAPQDIVDVEPA